MDAVSPDVVVDQLLSAGPCCFCAKRWFSVISVVEEVDMLKLADVEVGSKFTSPFRNIGVVPSKTVGVGRRG